MQRKYARPLARQGLESLERAACAEYVPGRNRNLKVNVRLEGLSSEPVLLPIWVMAYRYQNQVFRFLINGQTGKATGEAPNLVEKAVRSGHDCDRHSLESAVVRGTGQRERDCSFWWRANAQDRQRVPSCCCVCYDALHSLSLSE